MDLSIAAILAQDGVTSGAIYALLALALVLVFSVTRVIFIPQGEFVAYGALTLAAIQANKAPLSASMLVVLGVLTFLVEMGRTVSGKALRATAVNRLGARLVGIGTTQAGRLAFTLAAALGALCGILIAPLTTVYYESGFLIGLKGFVGAIVGGLVSYPVAALGALLVGLLESYSSFWASAFKEVIVFTLIIPVLLWRSLTTKHVEEEE